MPNFSEPFARIDRQVTQRGEGLEAQRIAIISELADLSRLVLLGEPGSGKSTAFRQAAADAGTRVVTARDFVRGERPPGQVVFIDALEEFRIGEAGRDRLSDLADALCNAPYARWRIACRAIALPPAETRFLSDRLGDLQVWQLDPLDPMQIRAILSHAGAADPAGFVSRIQAMAATPLLGNPATLLLLNRTVLSAGAPIHTRGELLEAATYQMAHELNADLPERPDRPEPSKIVAAAEAACLMLLLSARSDLWALDKPAPRADLVTFDDLVPAGVSTLALRFALDTAMFRGEAGAFIPTHRMVAEFLGGRALARATDPEDASQAALSVERAIAFLSGDDDRPAPAMTGVYAWFVSALARTRHAARALDLVRRDPESILLHGDPAMLPTPHRRALLDAAGRGDPWFLSTARGSTAIGGLAGEDLAQAFVQILQDPAEEDHRKGMVLEALAVGRPVASLTPVLRALAIDPNAREWLRQRAMDALLAGAGDPVAERQALLTHLEGEAGGGPIMMRLSLLRFLVGAGASAEQLRRVIDDYATLTEGPIGYLRTLADALIAHPTPELFDQPLPAGPGRTARRSEASRMIHRVLAATIESQADLSAERLLAWLENAGLARWAELGEGLQEAMAAWANQVPSRPAALFAAILAAPKTDVWSAHDYRRYTGRELPLSVREDSVERLEALAGSSDVEGLRRAAEIACRLTTPADAFPALRARALAVMSPRAELFEQTLSWVNFVPDERWSERLDAAEAKRLERDEAIRARDRQWMAEHLEGLRSGAQQHALGYAAVQLTDGGMGDNDSESDEAGPSDRLVAWWGAEVAQAIREGWARLVESFPLNAAEQGREAATMQVSWINTAAALHAEGLVARDGPLDLTAEAALAVLRGHYPIANTARRDAVEQAAVRRLLSDADGRAVVLDYWRAALRAASADVPELHAFAAGPGDVSPILAELLRLRPILRQGALQAAIAVAVQRLDRSTLAALSQAALARRGLPLYAARLWTFVAFMLEPEAHLDIFDGPFCDEEGRKVFAFLYHSRLESTVAAFADVLPTTDTLVVRRLGAIYPPGARPRSSGIDDVVAAAIERLAQSPSPRAGAALEALAIDPGLAAWRNQLRNRAAAQAALRRATQFKAPHPRAVAKALRAGPPATPADLRAVVREVLTDLAVEIRDGDTSAWRGFWNRPHGGDKSPKDENDCRDLITDRLRDRLASYRIPAGRHLTEARSGNDRRVDLVVLGEGEAAVPVEAKRHSNKDLWTAAVEQLGDYAKSLGTGHGVYLVFWFGAAFKTPPRAGGAITTPQALAAALRSDLPEDLRDKIDVVVIDVADQETVTAKKKRSRAKAKIAL